MDLKDFFTAGSLATLGGCTGITWIVSNTARVLMGRDTKIIPFLIAQAVAFLAAYVAQALTGLVPIVITLVNGCLIFLTAGGFHGTAGDLGRGQGPGGGRVQGRGNIKFLTPWFKRSPQS